MKIQLAALALGVLLVGCNRREADHETGSTRDRTGMDTVVQSATVKDTAVIKADTNIDVDTVKKTDHIEDSDVRKKP